MSNLRLHSRTAEGCTLLSNIFIDRYMPRANGEFVKVYLYLLRYLPVPEHAFGLSDIADAFDCTETDVLRALRYWEKAGLLKLSFPRRKKQQVHRRQQSPPLPRPGNPGRIRPSSQLTPRRKQRRRLL